MNLALWVAAGLLAAAFLAAGLTKLLRPKAKLQPVMGWTEDFSQTTIRFIATMEVLGALGLILPAITGIAEVLVPIAALGLAAVMVGAIITHLRRGEAQIAVVNVVLLALALFVAWGRLFSVPF